jgi:hypothetical protein
MFDHERLEIYQLSLAWVILADEIGASLPRGRGKLADQTRFALWSCFIANSSIQDSQTVTWVLVLYPFGLV